MNQRPHPYDDNPSSEQQIAVLFERMGNFIEETRRSNRKLEDGQATTNRLLSDLIKRAEENERHISDLLQDRDNNEIWRNKHDDWHGPNDQQIRGRIGTRIVDLEQTRHDTEVKKGVWLSQWKALTASAGAGAGLAGLILKFL